MEMEQKSLSELLLLPVEISKDFKRDIQKRFKAKNATEEVHQWTIFKECPLCISFRKENCSDCPLKRFEGKDQAGCMAFLSYFLGDELRSITLSTWTVYWSKEKNKEARKSLKVINAIINDPTKIQWV